MPTFRNISLQMHLPSWLVKLLPIWAYVCPKCQGNVSKNSHECPYCGEKYPLPLKLPPSILKDRKALENYVHEVVFPKVSAEYREYLTQFFTELFSDGFESGLNWELINGATVVNSPVHHGSNSIRVRGDEWAANRESFTPSSEVFFRCYVYVEDMTPSANWWQDILQIRHGSADLMALGCIDSPDYGAHFYWNARWFNMSDGTMISQNSALEVVPETWHCMEMRYKITGTTNEIELFIDGVSVTELIVTTAQQLQCDGILIGGQKTGGYSSYEYVDCVVVADGYIGVESAETLQTVIDSLSLSDSAVRHKALLLISDSAALAEAFSRGKALGLIDSLNLAEVERVLKDLLVQDASSLADAASTPTRVMKLAENVS